MVKTCTIIRHVNFEYGMYLVLWSSMAFVKKGHSASLAKAAIDVLTNVYIAVTHHLNQESILTPKSWL